MPTTTRKPRKKKGPKSVQLFKVLRELNVSADTVVETLREKEYELDAKLAGGDLNAKLTPEMYAAVLDAFADDAEARARVEELRAELHAEERAAEGLPPEDPKAPAPVEEPEAPAEEADAEAPADQAPVAPAEPVIEAPADEETPVAPAEPVIDATPDPVEVEPEAAAEAAPGEADEPAETPEQEEEAVAAEAPEAPDLEAAPEADEEEPATAETAEADPAPDAAAAEDTPEATEDIAEPGADDEDVEDAEEEGVLRGDRYNLSGPTVVGKIDLTGVETGRRRKRKRKKEVTPAAAESAAESAKGRKRGKKGGKKKVDQAEVQANIQETLQALGQGTGRSRQKRRRERREERAAERQAQIDRLEEMASTLRVMEFISTGELAEAMRVPVSEVIQKGFGLGMMVSINQRLDADAITLIADEFGFDVEFMSEVDEELELIEEDAPEDLAPRSPVVTIMGHVDHGKTSLLDYIRRANVVAGETGGITQHIGAYSVELEGERNITFLDTPGHEAFTAMRARGAQVTDLVIVVVAADDQVMPQTVEAINHARAAEVPLVVAINKMDRPEANPDRIMQQLSERGVMVEQYGGKVQAELISAKTGDNVDDLLEKVLIEAELLELQANPDRNAVGTVIEARLDKGRGVVATVLVETGTLRVGDVFVAGTESGRVRAMFDERDNRVEEAGPSTPVAILGFSGSPEVGDRLVVLEDEREARDIAAKRAQLQREQTMHARRHVSLDDLSRRLALGELNQLNLVVKGDVGGSVEALSDALLKISNDEVAVNIVHGGVGAITESDIMLAAASDAIVIGFQVRPVPGVRAVAEREEIDVRLYSVIYDAIEEVRDALEGLLSPEQRENTLATIEVRETFRVPKAGTIAGCYVVEGKVHRNNRVRLVRDGVVIYTGSIGSLRRFKDDVREVAAGYECGLSIDGYNDIKVGDTIEAFEIVEEKRQLTV
ncbi:MAG: translation initiation factor IF-2 [Rubricoccaceae bacterium]|nr:translation initiation factor IF-2 [Rubricoccaceae bacterium]